MTGAAIAADLVVALVALVAGYLIGSIPLAASTTRSTGKGWTFLAVIADVAKGVIPVAAGIVTVSWMIGWVAGVGAVLGAAVPAFGRRSATGADRITGVGATFVGAAFTLAPPAGALAAAVALAVLGVGRVLRRDGSTVAVAVAVAIGVYPLLFVALQPDPARLGALLGLYLVVAVTLLALRRR